MYYNKHILFCRNNENPESCGNVAQDEPVTFLKNSLKSLEMWGEAKIRASSTNCLGRCNSAPACVIYPEGIWYSYIDEQDLQEIVESHLLQDTKVARLLI